MSLPHCSFERDLGPLLSLAQLTPSLQAMDQLKQKRTFEDTAKSRDAFEFCRCCQQRIILAPALRLILAVAEQAAGPAPRARCTATPT